MTRPIFGGLYAHPSLSQLPGCSVLDPHLHRERQDVNASAP